MEWSWRTVLILIALVVIGYIVFDGIRRMRRAQAEALRLDVSHDFRFPEDDRNPELPSGGFRVVGKKHAPEADDAVEPVFAAESDEPEVVSKARPAAKTRIVLDPLPDLDGDQVAAADDAQPEIPEYFTETPAEQDKPLVDWNDDLGPVRVISAAKAEEKRHEPVSERVQDLVIPQSPLIPKARPVNLDEAVPVLLDVEELGSDDVEPVFGSMDDIIAGASAFEDEPVIVPVAEKAPVKDKAPAPEKVAEPDDLYGAADEEQNPHLEQEVDDIPADLVSQPVNFAGANAESLAARPMPELVLEIHCIAHDPQGFPGKDILFLFNSCDLRFGEKKIFHRFEEPDGAGCIQFSVSQSYEPGVFVPAAMAQQHFRGLSFFMSLPGAKRPMEAYEAMSEMALVIARKLKADLYDGARSALTPQTMEHDRQQIMDYERRQKLAQKKQARR